LQFQKRVVAAGEQVGIAQAGELDIHAASVGGVYVFERAKGGANAASACALSCSTSLFMDRPRLCASDLSRCAVSSGKRMVKVLISIPPDIARV
jgi:hypothetical protein